jgi:hypothetical protein
VKGCSRPNDQCSYAPLSPSPTATMFCFCEFCKTLWTGMGGRFLEHHCPELDGRKVVLAPKFAYHSVKL